MFIGRELELKALNQLHEENKFQLFILYGRRRVGKTTLLKEFCKNKPAIFYSAEQSNEKINLEKFSALIFEHYDETLIETFSSWENALLYIHHHQSNKPLILVLDEFPYLANMNPALLSILQHLIDHTLQYGNLFIVLCGSYMGFMEKEVLSAKSPLFGRRTGQLHMKPFDYYTSCKFLSDFSKEEQLMFYGTFGGTAMYLNQVNPKKSMKQNIIDILLKPTGYLYEEPLLLLRQEVQEPSIYYALIESIANGAVRSNEISQKIGELPAKCLKYIATLRELGILYRELPFGNKSSSRKTQYGVSDFMFRFWYRYVSKNKTLLETDGSSIVWERRIEPTFNHYMGTVFETICHDYLLRKNSLGQLPLLITSIGRWWGTDTATKTQIEIDIIANDENDYLFCECKWRNELLDLSVLKDLQKKADIYSSNRNNTWFFLFSKSGFTKSLENEAATSNNIFLITLDDLFF